MEWKEGLRTVEEEEWSFRQLHKTKNIQAKMFLVGNA